MPVQLTKLTIKNRIVHYLRYHPGWQSGLELEYQARFWQSKPSIISRRARELALEGKIERRLDYQKNVQYKLKEVI